MSDPTALFKALADPIRLRCLALIRTEGQLCVCELVAALEMTQPKISRHLAMLRKLGVAETERRGQWVYYGLSAKLTDWERRVIDTTLDGLSNDSMFGKDRKRLSVMADRPNCCD